MGERCQGGERKRSPADHAVKTRIFIAAPFSPPLTPQAITHESAGYSGSFFFSCQESTQPVTENVWQKKGRRHVRTTLPPAWRTKKSSVRAGHHDHYCHLCSKLPQRCTFLRQEMTVFFLFCCIFCRVAPLPFFRAPDLQEANFVSLAPPRVLLFRRKTATCFSAPCLTRRGAKRRQGAEVGEKVEEALRSRCHAFALVHGQQNRRSFQESSRQKRWFVLLFYWQIV